MTKIEERTKKLVEILRANGFDIKRDEWEACGTGDFYETYEVIDCENNNISLTGTGYAHNPNYPELDKYISNN